MNGLIARMRNWLSPRYRAERLIMARLDARRGDGHIEANDEAWLDRRLDADLSLRRFAAEQEALQALLYGTRSGPSAPGDFAARVVQAAKTSAEVGVGGRPSDAIVGAAKTSIDVRVGARPAEDAGGAWVWALGGAAVAAVALLVVFARLDRVTPVGGLQGELEVSGQSGGTLVRPDFMIRAPGIGAAQARLHIVSIVKRHHGMMTTEGESLQVRLPREELVPVMQDLAKAGPFKVTPLRQGPMPPDVQTVVLRFRLD